MGLGNWYGRVLDEPAMRWWNDRAAAGEASAVASMAADLQSQLGGARRDALGDLPKRIADMQAARGLTAADAEVEEVARRLEGFYSPNSQRFLKTNQSAADQLIQEAAVNEAQKAMFRPRNFYGLMGSDSVAGRATQIGVYGSGITLGLTASGQGLMALADYLQKGQQTQVARDEPLPG